MQPLKLEESANKRMNSEELWEVEYIVAN